MLADFFLDDHKNQLLPIGHNGIFLGKFNGRAEAVFSVTPADHGVFVFVIEGAFEVQHRLMHAKDGLALWDVPEMELEALSNDAIVLVAAIPMHM